MTRVRLDQFRPDAELERGRSRWFEALWYLCKCAFFLSALPWPNRLKCSLLRCFGATVGEGVVIKPRVNIYFPQKLVIGSHSWIGEEVFILNLERIEIGGHCCISQRAFLCTGNHDYRDPVFPYRGAAITVEDGAWIGAAVFVGPGIRIGAEAVAAAGSVVTADLPGAMICAGNPCVPVKKRWKDDGAG
ncbi:MAG: WcaF family extracellular polysaccharide biosynthesis acetyltransferase [Chthoniobacteraceae bacterium]